MIGSRRKHATFTRVERKTPFVMLVHLPNGRTAPAMRDALIERIHDLPEHLRRSLTWDQGREMREHEAIKVYPGLDVYFCDPHSPWQRGSNENTNGLLRQYFPKGTDFKDVMKSQHDAARVHPLRAPRPM